MGPVHASFRHWSANHSKKKSSINTVEERRDLFGPLFKLFSRIWATPHWQHIAEHCEFMPRAIAPSILQMQHGHPSSTNSRISAPSSTRVLSLAPFPYCVDFVCLICSGASKDYVSNTAEGRKNVIRPRFLTFLPDLTNSLEKSIPIANSRLTTHAIALLIFHVQYGYPSSTNNCIACRCLLFLKFDMS